MKLKKTFSHFSYDFSDTLLQKDVFKLILKYCFKLQVAFKRNLFPQFLFHYMNRNTEQLDEPVSVKE